MIHNFRDNKILSRWPGSNNEGRLIIAHFGRLAVASVYFPNGSGRDRSNSRVPYKLAFYSTLFERLQELRRRGPVFAVRYFRALDNKSSKPICRTERNR